MKVSCKGGTHVSCIRRNVSCVEDAELLHGHLPAFHISMAHRWLPNVGSEAADPGTMLAANERQCLNSSGVIFQAAHTTPSKDAAAKQGPVWACYLPVTFLEVAGHECPGPP